MESNSSILSTTVSNAEKKLRSSLLMGGTLDMLGEPRNDFSPSAETRESLHSKFPKEFEYYACAFELTDSSGNTVDFFSFPVMPSQISESLQNNASIRKTSGGVIVNKNPTFIPFNTQISGDFGRRFRFLGGRSIDANGRINSVYGDNSPQTEIGKTDKDFYSVNGSSNIFDTDCKTGYGSTKLLERILRRSLAPDSSGKPFNLYFYNLAFDSKYNVEFITTNFSISQDRNMIWRYAISLRFLAPAENTLSADHLRSSLKSLMTLSRITNISKRQSAAIFDVSKDSKERYNKLSPAEKLLYNISQKVNGQNGILTKFGQKHSAGIDMIEQILKRANNNNRAMIGALNAVGINGLDITSKIQRARFISRRIIGG